ncbi:hypothetical protein [Massilia endophytica]|uniref:hypothetical protein n=1 Tax=Massilia endophytica TaxID=2899220 RepID=UPI001E32B577|nr:hypothetical protein [Massilia endophytica]UGQ45590.1 hypothetical protein LSQ66_17605 [Massilia endophytica]
MRVIAILSTMLSAAAAAADPAGEALAAAYPGARVLARCEAAFGTAGVQELAAVVKDAAGAVRRVAVLRTPGGWEPHDLDREILRDARLSRQGSDWNRSGGTDAFKCNPALPGDKDLSDKGRMLDRPPFFQRGSRAVVCFGTSDTYNNWDCLAFRPEQNSFRLWYQQVFAD